MNDIPEDVSRAAKAVMAANGFENAESDTFTTFYVARAILAERQRCAAVARAYLEDIAGCSLKEDEPDLIAAAILHP